MNTITDTKFSVQAFKSLDDGSRRAIYQKANEDQDVDRVRQLNELGMKPSVPSFSGPSIISRFMDMATKHDVILGFLKELRKTNKLLTKTEAQSLPSEEWVKKYKPSRMLGCDYLMQKVRENNLKHIKVPKKIAVVEETETLVVEGWYEDDIYDLYSDQIKVYGKRIASAERKLSREEIDELIQVIAAANFTDLLAQNVVLAKDGIYFIDTEFKSFRGDIDWFKMERFMELVSEADMDYFMEKVNEKRDGPRTIKEDLGYYPLSYELKRLREGPQSEESDKLIAGLEGKVSSLQYVGAGKAGSSHWKCNKFSFNREDIGLEKLGSNV